MHIEEHLLAYNIVGAFNRLKDWYRKFTGKVLKQVLVELSKIQETYANLFSKSNLEKRMPYDFDYDGKEVNDSTSPILNKKQEGTRIIPTFG